MSLDDSYAIEKSLDEDTPVKPKKDTKAQVAGWLQIILVAGVLIAGLAVNAILSSTDTTPRQTVAGSSTIPVEVIRPRIEDKPFRVSGSGVIQSRNAIDLSPQVSGRVVSVSPNLASGGSFEAGDVLFRLDDASLNAVSYTHLTLPTKA